MIGKMLREDILDRYDNEEYWDWEIVEDFMRNEVVPADKEKFNEILNQSTDFDKSIMLNELFKIKEEAELDEDYHILEKINWKIDLLKKQVFVEGV